MRSTAVTLVAITAVGMSGCDSAPVLAPVSGTVTLDGELMPHKLVRFVPEPGTPGLGAARNTDANGQYTLLALLSGATKDRPGVSPGKYKVIITEPQLPVDLPVADTPEGEPAPAIASPNAGRRRRRGDIPYRYTTEKMTDLRVTVPPEGGVFDLTLTTSP